MQLRKLLPFCIFSAVLFSCTNEDVTTDTPATVNPTVAADERLLNDSTTADSVREQQIELLVLNNQYNRALEQIDQLLAKDSANPAWLYMKADALEKSGDTTAALLHYNKAVNSAGVFAEAELRAANLFAETGNKNALTLCDNLLKNQGAVRFRSDILMIKGIYYTKVRQPDKALEIFNQIIREDYSYMDAYIEKGLVYYDQKKFMEAWNVFKKSTEVKNAFADGYFWMAKAEEKMNKKEEAIANYKRSLALDQSLADARDALKRLGEIK